jgi:hypothetical protein
MRTRLLVKINIEVLRSVSTVQNLTIEQPQTSDADPGYFYPGSGHFSIPDPDRDPNIFSSQILYKKGDTNIIAAFFAPYFFRSKSSL